MLPQLTSASAVQIEMLLATIFFDCCDGVMPMLLARSFALFPVRRAVTRGRLSSRGYQPVRQLQACVAGFWTRARVGETRSALALEPHSP